MFESVACFMVFQRGSVVGRPPYTNKRQKGGGRKRHRERGEEEENIDIPTN